MNPERVLLLGSRGLLGASLAQTLRNSHTSVQRLDRADVNVADADQLKRKLELAEFDILINATGHTAVDDCEFDERLATLVNGEAPGVMAQIAATKGARLVHFSTDYVFDGASKRPYVEEDPARPISAYGRSKLAGERAVLKESRGHFVIRLSWLFGPGRSTFPEWILRTVLTDKPARIVADKFACPTYALDIAGWIEALISHDSPGGIYHLCNSSVCAWSEYGQCVLDAAYDCGILAKPQTVEPIKLADLSGLTAQRPLYSALNTAKFTDQTGVTPRLWQEAVREHVQSIDRRSLTR